jgi:putative DNA primase/helicase
MSAMLEAALHWARLGVAVFPLRGEREHLKKPRIAGGFDSASLERSQIERWWGQWPTAGIGGATGSCGAWVLDIDLDKGGLVSLRQLERQHGALPPTRTVRTGGGGLHLWFAMPDRSITNRAKVRDGIDVRGTGGYVVLPPSPHESGRSYVLEDDRAPVPAPDWLVELVTSKRHAQALTPASAIAAGVAALELGDRPGDRQRIAGMVRAAVQRIGEATEGSRNDTVNTHCYSIGGYLDAAGVTVDEVAPMLELAAAAAEQPVEMVRRVLADGRRDGRPMPPDGPLLLRRREGGSSARPPSRPEPSIDQVAAQGVPAVARPLVEGELPPELDPDCLRLPYTDLGNARRMRRHFGTNIRWCEARQNWVHWTGSHWDWDERSLVHGHAQETVDRLALEVKEWRRQFAEETVPDERKKLEAQVEAAAKHHVRSQASGRIEAILRQVRGLPGLSVAMGDFDSDSWLLNVRNGTLELRSGRCRPHRREDLNHRAAPVVYDPKAACPVWDRFVLEVFPDKTVRHFVQRFIGYCLTGDISEQVWILMQGEGSNGKSTLLEVIAALLGSYATALPAGFLEYRRHEQHPTELTDLHRARFATGTEPRADEKWDAEKIKRLTGGDVIKARFMRGDFFEFLPTQKLLVSCNEMPRTTDMGTGFWRRVVIVPFTQRWYREDEPGTPKVDPELGKKLREELPGILNWALEGLRDWREGGLQIPNACRLATQEYRKEQDPLPRFLEERCELGAGFSTKMALLYEAYLKWHRVQPIDERPLSKVQLGKRLSSSPYNLPTYEGHARAAMRGGLRLLSSAELEERDGEERPEPAAAATDEEEPHGW